MIVRRASLARDGEELLAAMRAGYAVEAGIIGYADLPPLRDTLDDLGGEELWVAVLDGEIAGVVGLAELEGDLAIVRLAVAPVFMRRGVGRALVHHAVALAGDRAVRVGTAAANRPALALYGSLGFARVGESVVGGGLAYVSLRRSPGLP